MIRLASLALLITITLPANVQAYIPEGEYIPESYIYDSEGAKKFLDEFEGQVTLLVFWASWSSDCPEELIKLDNLAKDFKTIPMNIVAVSLNYQKLVLIDEFYQKYEIRHLKKYYDYRHKLFKMLSTNSVPTSYLLDKEGRIIWQEKGPKSWNQNEIRATLINHIEGVDELPRNSFKESLLRNKILK